MLSKFVAAWNLDIRLHTENDKSDNEWFGLDHDNNVQNVGSDYCMSLAEIHVDFS